MKISVITVCKNSEPHIEKAIQSVVTQTYPEIEYIIIDGASEDKTVEIANRFSEHITHLVSEPDTGVYQAMNKGIQLATGSLIYFLNSDDYLVDSEVLQDVAHFLSEHPDCDFVYGGHEARFRSGKSSIYQPAPPDRMLEEMVSLGECFIQPASFFKAELFSKLGGFSEEYKIASDYEWFTRLLQDDAKICHYPRVIVSYSHGGLSSQIRPLFEEVFAIQNSTPLYQSEDWLNRRLLKLQTTFIDKYELLESTHDLSEKREQHINRLEPHAKALKSKIESLQSRIRDLEAEVTAMKTSKFWQIRSLWFKVKKAIGLPTND